MIRVVLCLTFFTLCLNVSQISGDDNTHAQEKTNNFTNATTNALKSNNLSTVVQKNISQEITNVSSNATTDSPITKDSTNATTDPPKTNNGTAEVHKPISQKIVKDSTNSTTDTPKSNNGSTEVSKPDATMNLDTKVKDQDEAKTTATKDNGNESGTFLNTRRELNIYDLTESLFDQPEWIVKNYSMDNILLTRKPITPKSPHRTEPSQSETITGNFVRPILTRIFNEPEWIVKNNSEKNLKNLSQTTNHDYKIIRKPPNHKTKPKHSETITETLLKPILRAQEVLHNAWDHTNQGIKEVGTGTMQIASGALDFFKNAARSVFRNG